MFKGIAVSLLIAAGGAHAQGEIGISRRVVPVFNDGVESLVSEFTFSTGQPENVRAVRVVAKGITDPADVEEVSIYRIDKKGDQLLARSKGVQTTLLPAGPAGTSVELSKGNHRCALKIKTRSGADLTRRIGLRIEGIDFADDRRIEVGPAEEFPSSRLAYRIHRKGEHSCDTFRIPGLSRANDGSLLAVYDMRHNSNKDLQEDIDIGLSRSADGGRTWTAPRPIMDMGGFGGKPQKENGCSDPNILVDRSKGTILVSALWTYGKPGTHQWKDGGSGPGLSPDETTQFMIVRSEDHGITWSSPINMTARLKRPEWWLFAPAPGNGITLRNGILVMPTQGRDEKGVPFSNLISSKDGGIHGRFPPSPGTTPPNARSRNSPMARCFSRCVTTATGRTRGPPTAARFPSRGTLDWPGRCIRRTMGRCRSPFAWPA